MAMSRGGRPGRFKKKKKKTWFFFFFLFFIFPFFPGAGIVISLLLVRDSRVALLFAALRKFGRGGVRQQCADARVAGRIAHYVRRSLRNLWGPEIHSPIYC